MITAIAEYLFTDCQNQTVTSTILANGSSLFGSFLIDHERIQCRSDRGVNLKLSSEESLPLESMRNLTRWPFVNVTGFSLSVWLDPANYAHDAQPIVTIGGHQRVNDPLRTQRGCPGYNLRLAQFRNSLAISYVDNDPYKNCPIHIIDRELQPSTLTHFLVSFTNGQTAVSMDGQLLFQSINYFEPKLSHWEEPMSLQLLTNYASMAAFRGYLTSVAIYNAAFSPEESFQIYRQGIEKLNVPLLGFNEGPPIVIPQDSLDPVAFELSGYSHLTKNNSQIFVEFLETPRLGTLAVLLGTEEKLVTVTVGLRIPFNGTTQFSYTLGQTDKFSTPAVYHVTEEEGFTVRLVTNDPPEYQLASRNFTREIAVTHVNHRACISASSVATFPPKNFSSTEHSLFVKRVKIFDKHDHDLDRIRVNVVSHFGRLTIDAKYRHLADFYSCAYHEPWACRGTGLRDYGLNFIATPGDTELLLSHIIYEADRPFSPATNITFEVWDGEGGECLSSQMHDAYSVSRGLETTTIRRGCYYDVAVVSVPSADTYWLNDKRNEERGGGFSGWLASKSALLDWRVAIYLLLATGFVFCCCCAKFMNDLCAHCLARGASVPILGSAKSDDESVAAYSDQGDEEDVRSTATIQK